jgi:hypothetical protein
VDDAAIDLTSVPDNPDDVGGDLWDHDGGNRLNFPEFVRVRVDSDEEPDYDPPPERFTGLSYRFSTIQVKFYTDNIILNVSSSCR